MNIIKSVFLILFIAISFISCSNDDRLYITPVDSPKSFFVLGYCTPAPENSLNAKYSIVGNTIAQSNFDYNNINYNYRASKKLEELLSLYNNLNNYKNYIDDETSVEIIIQTNNKEYIAYWNIKDVYYSLSSEYENGICDLSSILIKNKA